MDYWYLWVILIVLCIATAVVLRFATKALALHNDDKQAIIKELERLTALKEKYTELTPEKIESADALELLEGVTAVMQAKVEKAENPTNVFNTFNDVQKEIYTLNYFVEDVRTSLSFFYKNNGEPLVSYADKALVNVGEAKLGELATTEFAMYDNNNEDVSVSVEKMKETDDEFSHIYDENKLLISIREYIKSNIDKF